MASLGWKGLRYFYDSELTAIRELYGSAELRLDSFKFQRIRFMVRLNYG
jgi:hypothetical protein